MSPTWQAVLEGLVVLLAIFLGVRTGGIGLGLWGATGTAVLIFVFGADPGSPPIDAFFIIIAVITASAVMQAAGGIDWLVSIASRIIRRNPRRITLVAPLVAFAFTLGAGTSNIFFALIPVIYETSYRNGVRPERPLAASTVTSALGITASPVSAAMAAYLTLLPDDFTLADILTITIPASIVACVVTSLVQNRIGKNLDDDQEYQARLRAGQVPSPAEVGADQHAALPKTAARSAYVFLAAVVVIVVLGLFDELRPTVTVDKVSGPLSMTIVIEVVMFTAALVNLLWNRVPPGDVVKEPLMESGLVAAIALFGIAWMADTYLVNNQETVVNPLADIVKDHSWFLAVAIFLVAGLTTSQSATTRTIIPIALASLSPATITAMWPSLVGVWLFPANGSQIAAVNIDKTGTTRLSKVPIWHSFTIPMLVSWVSVVLVGLLIASLAF
ncbi:anaerobic C4-dicarboxylate transporter family protein [Kribbella sp. NPDC058693]|uniref:anaerobic C4-dicarboxylate transporter family protein n=1 Tax=Kribbella sp. NPDC058693 TaxID=3346602 RepID=UPI0036651C2A